MPKAVCSCLQRFDPEAEALACYANLPAQPGVQEQPIAPEVNGELSVSDALQLLQSKMQLKKLAFGASSLSNALFTESSMKPTMLHAA